ncbi:MAG: TonB-dependent siderophore receptor [Cellvibrio sp.]|uniref:TonB-dependent siderophore receptor n=1 Tax=Cellvibrio sp. TaxID=1965322 RepID=UPI0031B0EDF3
MKHTLLGARSRVAVPSSLSIVPSLLLAVSLLGASSLPVLAATADSTEVATEQRRYDIPAGSLADNLNRFAVAAGVALIFDPKEIPNRQSAGLNGTYNLNEGFAKLLEGSGLAVRYESATGSYRLEKAVASGGLLPTVRVESTTEGTGSYTTGLTNTATRLDLSIRETPQSVTVVTRQRIEDQGMNEIASVLDNTVGLVVNTSGPLGSDNNMVYARGFPLENYQVDGVARSTRFGFQNDIADMALFDRVEVVRGASGLLNGVGEPSGAVNLVRKLPTTEFQAYVAGKYGSWNHYRTEADVSGPLTADGEIRGRLVAAWQDNESFVDRLGLEKKILYGVLETNLTDATIWSVGIEYQDHKSTGGDRFGAPLLYADGTPTNFSRTTNLNPDWGYHTRENLSIFSTVEHYFENDWRVKLDLEKSKREYDSVMPTTALAGGWFDVDTVSAGRWAGEPEQNSINLHAVGKYTLFGRAHDLVVGGSYYDSEENGSSYNYTDAPIDDLDALIKTGKFPKLDVSSIGDSTYTMEKQSGFYVATRVKPVDNLSIILGSRVSNWETRYDYTDVDGVTDVGATSKDSSVVTPYAGIVVDINKYLSLYASYTDIFKPSTNYDAAGMLLEPAEGSNTEAGAKLAFFDNKLNLLATYYKTLQDNVPEYVPGPNGGINRGPTGHYVYQGIDGTETTGYELEISGQLTSNWELGGGFSEADPKDAKGQPRLTHIPQQTFKMFTHYQPTSWIEGLSIGGNLRWQDATHSSGINFSQGSFTLVDLMAQYKITSQLHAALNINNLFDKTYYTSIQREGWFGEPRSAYVTLRYNF